MRRRSFLTTAAALPLAAPAIAQPAKTQALRFIPQANLTSLDPIWTTATVTNNHGYYVYDTLYSADAQMRPQPQMAEGHTVSDDGRTWRIRLRPGLKFHDGTPVRAVDANASIARWCKRDAFGQILDGMVVEWNAPDDRTMELKLKRPFPLLLDALAKPDASVPFIMPERLAKTDANKAITEVVGSGPYRFLPDEYVSGARVAYAKFEDYAPRAEQPEWATGAKIAYFPRVEWNVIPDPGTAAAAIQRGEADWWERPFNDLIPTMLKDPGVTSMIADPSGRLSVLRFNTLHPPFNDVKIRRAVMAAVNQDDYMRAAVGDDRELWRRCASLFPCGTPYATETEGAALMPGRLDQARRMLADAGYSGQRVVIINPTDFPLIGPLGQVTADLLQQMGMNVDLQASDWGTVVQRRTSREPVDKGGWSIFHTTGSSSGWINPAVSQVVRGQGGKGWFGWWADPQIEAMTQQWFDAPDEPTQTKIARQIGVLAMQQAPTVPLGQFFIRTVFRKRITGMLQGPCPYPWNIRPA
ncbi:MAG: ABC transporter substrate-binding protein [Proteobacteria bacterium]|nr:ABC transporter substrate-binding protein [Pseudomonadota bacterium]